MQSLLYCRACRRRITDEDYVFHAEFETFDKENPFFCFRCERKLMFAIEGFIKDTIEQNDKEGEKEGWEDSQI